MQKIILILISIFIYNISFGQENNITQELQIESICLTLDENKLYNLIMEYRKKKRLPPITLSRSLTYVAKAHAMDLHINRPFKSKRCNMHSWSKNDIWTSCCYTSNHVQADCMWYKPRELTNYQSEGYEIAFGYGNRDDYLEHGEITPENALKGWKQSTGHNNTIVNKSQWKKIEWQAIGIAIYKDFALVWFGEELDEASLIQVCIEN